MEIIFFLTKYIILILMLSFFFSINDKISIIIPTYNREKYILNSIQSISNQTYFNIEIIIIDDCSTDNTAQIIKKIKDNRIKYIKLKNRHGAPYARNLGIKLANGKFISFQDSDDIYHYDKLEKQMKNLKKQNSDLDFCKINVHINITFSSIFPYKRSIKSIVIGKIYEELISFGNFISTQSILVKKLYIEKYFFDVNFPRLQDYDLMLRMIPNLKVSFTNEVLVELFRHNDSIGNDSNKLKKSLNLLLKKNYKFNNFEKIKFKNYITNTKKIFGF